MKLKKRRTELQSAENRYQSIIEKRNELNVLAKALREERDLIHDRKKTTADYVRELKAERNKLVAIRKEHIKLRNHYQSKGKELISQKRDRTKKIYPDLPSEVEALKAELKMLDQRQQTSPLSLKKERELLDTIKKKKMYLDDLEKKLTNQSSLNLEVKKIDGNIDDLFKKGDEEHLKVVNLSEKVDELHEKMGGLVEELNMMNAEATRKHEQYLKMRERANKYHEKAQEFRTKVLTLKKEKNADMVESKKDLRKLNVEVKDYFEDKKKINKHTDDELDRLKKGKKIEF